MGIINRQPENLENGQLTLKQKRIRPQDSATFALWRWKDKDSAIIKSCNFRKKVLIGKPYTYFVKVGLSIKSSSKIKCVLIYCKHYSYEKNSGLSF